MKMKLKELNAAHRYSINNMPDLMKDSKCGCFYCLKIFAPDEITEIIEDRDGTAVCPYCGIDSVIGEYSGYPITKEFLQEMYDRWFENKKPKK